MRCTTSSPVSRHRPWKESLERWQETWSRICWMVSLPVPCSPAQKADKRLSSFGLLLQPAPLSIRIYGGTDPDLQAARYSQCSRRGASLARFFQCTANLSPVRRSPSPYSALSELARTPPPYAAASILFARTSLTELSFQGFLGSSVSFTPISSAGQHRDRICQALVDHTVDLFFHSPLLQESRLENLEGLIAIVQLLTGKLTPTGALGFPGQAFSLQRSSRRIAREISCSWR